MAEDSRSFSAINPASLAKYEARQAARDSARALTPATKKKKKKKYEYGNEYGINLDDTGEVGEAEDTGEMEPETPGVELETTKLNIGSDAESESEESPFLSSRGPLFESLTPTVELSKPETFEQLQPESALQNPLTADRGMLDVNSQVKAAADLYRTAKTPEEQTQAMLGYREALLAKQAEGSLLTGEEQNQAAWAAARDMAHADATKYNAFLMRKGIDPFTVGQAVLQRGGGMDVLSPQQEQQANYNADRASKAWSQAMSKAAAYKDAYERSGRKKPEYLDMANQVFEEAKAIADLSGGTDPRNPTAGFNVDNARRVATRQAHNQASVQRAEREGLAAKGTADKARAQVQQLEQLKEKYARADRAKAGAQAVKEEVRTAERREPEQEPRAVSKKRGEETTEEEQDRKDRVLREIWNRRLGNSRMRKFLDLPGYERNYYRG